MIMGIYKAGEHGLTVKVQDGCAFMGQFFNFFGFAVAHEAVVDIDAVKLVADGFMEQRDRLEMKVNDQARDLRELRK